MPEARYPEAKLLIADTDPAHGIELQASLRRLGYRRVQSTERLEALPELFCASPPELLLFSPPDGPVPTAREIWLPEPVPPTLAVLTRGSTTTLESAYSLGVGDVLLQPFDPIELLLRTENLLNAGYQVARAESSAREAVERVQERLAGLQEAQDEVLERLALAAEYRDDTTGLHVQRVGQLSALVTHALGRPNSEVGLIRRAAPLHDVGKIALPDAILLKPARLLPHEFDVVKTHTTLGSNMLSRSRFPVLQWAAEIALSHHERWDGGGYPLGLAGDAIPLMGRIVAVTDVWDALVHQRPYKPAWPRAQALREIERQSGAHFDPRVVRAFMHVIEQYAL